jgi:hypothetical protein
MVWFMRRFNWTPSQVRAEDAAELMRLRALLIQIEQPKKR